MHNRNDFNQNMHIGVLDNYYNSRNYRKFDNRIEVTEFKRRSIYPYIVAIMLIALPCFAFAQTQYEMNLQTCNELKEADKQLNIVYNDIVVKYKDESGFATRLRNAQNAWIKQRDLELDLMYNPEENYGTITGTCVCSYATQLTNERTKALKVYLNGAQDGNVCTGSIIN